jgi:hypothetical protein
MSIYSPLSWQNESALSSYPFEEDFEVNDFIVDASFIQFDGFVPVMSSVFVDKDDISLDITFDTGVKITVKLYRYNYNLGASYRKIKIYNPGTERYFGVLTFGAGAETLWSTYVGRKISKTSKFLSSTVRSIPFNDAVYLFDGMFGDLALSRTLDDKTIFYNNYKDSISNKCSVVFNAVYGHAPLYADPGVLRKINLVSPVSNNVNLADNDVIKITPVENTYVRMDLVSGSTDSAFSLPTLFS